MDHLKPREAYKFLKENPDALFVDCRSEMEYMFVGHPLGAMMIPWYDGAEWELNPHFVGQVKKLAGANFVKRPVVLICRSGNRTIEAGEALERAGFNRVVSLHSRLQLDPTWSLSAQAMRSFTQPSGGRRVDAPGYLADLTRDGRHFGYEASYTDLGADFATQLGHVKRVDIRKFKQEMKYYWRPDQSRLVKFGPKVTTVRTTNHGGQVLDWSVEGQLELRFTGHTDLTLGRTEGFELYKGLGFNKHATALEFSTEWLKWLAIAATVSMGTEINFDPAPGLEAFLADAQEADLTMTVRPSPQLRFDQTFIYNRLSTRPGSFPQLDSTSARIFENPLVRWKLNYQISRALSMSETSSVASSLTRSPAP